MSKPIPLDEQIVAALTEACTSEQAAAVLSDAQALLTDLTKQADAADVASLSPLATAAKARELRQAASDHRFEADRMEASVSALEARLADLKADEAAARREAEFNRVLKIRDELAADIAKKYPAIVATMTDLVKRIVECDTLCQKVGIREGAESIGRGCPPNFYVGTAPLLRLADTVLPMPSGQLIAWEHNSFVGGWRWHGLAAAEA
jgi:uncharacterized protein YhaN